jgi:hypothetical protein
MNWITKSLVSAFVAMTTVACGSKVLVGTASGEGGGGANSSANGGAPSTSTSMTGQESVILYGSDPVKLRLTSFPLACAEADKSPPYEQCDWYNVELTFPAALLKPGHLPMNDPSVQLFMNSSGKPYSSSPGDCPGTGGGGDLFNSDWNILSVDTNSVEFEVTGFPGTLIDHDIDGKHVAERCAP